MKKILPIVIVVGVILGVFYFTNKKEVIAPGVILPAIDEKLVVEKYVRDNIKTLAPNKPVLGGSWYVTTIHTDTTSKTGDVTYEDGHIQETKTFSYTMNDKGEVVSLVINNSVACTQEAKQCPDGSYVGRTGPNCEFSLCSDTLGVPMSKKSGITGTVTLGPTCPVERISPDPNCAPRLYSTSIDIMKTGSTKIIKTIQSDVKGVFSTNLDPGMYVLQAQGGNVLPRCGEVSVEVKSGQYAKAEISCDTGIR